MDPQKERETETPIFPTHSDEDFQKAKICEIIRPSSCGLIIFGASGDLTKRKIIPSLYKLHRHGLLPEGFFALGTGRTEMSTEQFRESIRSSLKATFSHDFDETLGTEVVSKLYYAPLDYGVGESYLNSFKGVLLQLEQKHQTGQNRIYYLGVPPTVYEEIILNLGATGLSQEGKGYTHIVIEKPFGRDLESARKLEATLMSAFREEQIYRIDHYLAKETVQNILMFRFANSIFEPVWNRSFIDHIQITAAETMGIEHRAGYYEQAGVLRDMFQNHMFQLLALAAMEPPAAFEAEAVRNERVKVLQSIRAYPLDRLGDFMALGQYGPGRIDGDSVSGYREEPGVSSTSTTPTFAAMKVFVDNWRWNGVPFYLRSGKRLSKRKTEISIHFRAVPHLMFSKTLSEPIDPNTLVLRVQPDEGISLLFQTKKPDSGTCLKPVLMDFSYQREVLMDAYEWVLVACMHGDHMLFVREDEVDRSWAVLTPVIQRLESVMDLARFPNYGAGTSGPEQASWLIQRDGRAWRAI